MQVRNLIFPCSLLLIVSLAKGEENTIPPCYGPANWSATLAVSEMRDQGILKKSDSVLKNSSEIKTSLLEGKKIGVVSDPAYKNSNLYRQIQKIELKNNEGKSFELITISESSDLECSMSSPSIILISPEFKVLNQGDSYLFLQQNNLLPKITTPPMNSGNSEQAH